MEFLDFIFWKLEAFFMSHPILFSLTWYCQYEYVISVNNLIAHLRECGINIRDGRNGNRKISVGKELLMKLAAA